MSQGAFWAEIERDVRRIVTLIVFRCTRCRRLGCAAEGSLPSSCVCNLGR